MKSMHKEFCVNNLPPTMPFVRIVTFRETAGMRHLLEIFKYIVIRKFLVPPASIY